MTESKSTGINYIDITENSIGSSRIIEEIQQKPCPSAKEVLESIFSNVAGLKEQWEKQLKTTKNTSGLTNEQIILHLYTMEYGSPKTSLYKKINDKLRLEELKEKKGFHSYIRVLLKTLSDCKLYKSSAFCGSAADLPHQYEEGQVFSWKIFSIWTRDQKEIEKIEGLTTIFQLQICEGSLIPGSTAESEIILLQPGTSFQVSKIQKLKNAPKHVRVVFLKQIEARKPAHEWLELKIGVGNERIIKLPHQRLAHAPDIPRYFPKDEKEEKLFDRIQGSMAGMALGDALGAHVEFKPHDYMLANKVTDLKGGGTWGLKEGQFTDDTSMALCLAASLIVCRDFFEYDQLVRYKWWYRYGYMSSTGECFDIGNATRESIEVFEKRQRNLMRALNSTSPDMDSVTNREQLQNFDHNCSSKGVAGNGALMRLTPVPLFFHRDPMKAVEYSGISGQITHGDVKARDACRYYAALIIAALSGERKEELLDNGFFEEHRSWFNGEKLHKDIMNIARGSYKKPKGYEDGIRGGGYIVAAMEAALWAFRYDEDSFEKGALLAVNLGDDADTVAAIYGQLAGAYYGFKNLPEKWVRKLYARTFITHISAWLCYEGEEWFRCSDVSNGKQLEAGSTQSGTSEKSKPISIHQGDSNSKNTKESHLQDASSPKNDGNKTNPEKDKPKSKSSSSQMSAVDRHDANPGEIGGKSTKTANAKDNPPADEQAQDETQARTPNATNINPNKRKKVDGSSGNTEDNQSSSEEKSSSKSENVTKQNPESNSGNSTTRRDEAKSNTNQNKPSLTNFSTDSVTKSPTSTDL